MEDYTKSPKNHLVLANSNRARGRNTNPDPGHAVRTIQETLLYRVLVQRYKTHPDKCQGQLPEQLPFDPPAAPKGYQVDKYIEEAFGRMGITLIVHRIIERAPTQQPTWRMPHVSPNAVDPYACIRCHPWDGRYNSSVPPTKKLTTTEKIVLGTGAGVVAVVVVVGAAPVTMPGVVVIGQVGGTSGIAAGLLFGIDWEELKP